MGKKTDDADVKKECPSCGLGVALDAKVCEFCGWDFDEEDEWILQIEKLERDLVLEKQKFEPGTVGSRIEASLHSPANVKKEQMMASAAKAKLQQQMEEVLGTPEKPEEPQQPTPAASAMTSAMNDAGPREAQSLVTKEEPVDEEAPEEPKLVISPQATASQQVKVRRLRKVKGAHPAQTPPSTDLAQRSKGVRKGKE